MAISAPTKAKRDIRCGWCLAGDHDNCVLVVEMTSPDGPAKTRAKYPWRCPCLTCQAPELKDRTRCTECNRRGVTVDDMWHCVDQIDCIEYRKRKRAKDPVMQQIDQIRADLAAGKSPIDSEDPKLLKNLKHSGIKRAKTKAGACLCCGEATRGGKFLPGHDSRYVSQQATAYLALSDRTDKEAAAIYDAMEALGLKLHGKWVKTVERFSAKADGA